MKVRGTPVKITNNVQGINVRRKKKVRNIRAISASY
jgi:hypothetical protein